jgi:hypothetical protein
MHASGGLCRPASAADAAACVAIYRPYVEHTVISWETDPTGSWHDVAWLQLDLSAAAPDEARVAVPAVVSETP